MDQQQLEDALRQILIKNSALRIKSIAEDDSLAGDLGFDSLAFTMALSDLEDKFQVKFPVEKVDDLEVLRFRDLVGIVREQLSAKETATPVVTEQHNRAGHDT